MSPAPGSPGIHRQLSGGIKLAFESPGPMARTNRAPVPPHTGLTTSFHERQPHGTAPSAIGPDRPPGPPGPGRGPGQGPAGHRTDRCRRHGRRRRPRGAGCLGHHGAFGRRHQREGHLDIGVRPGHHAHDRREERGHHVDVGHRRGHHLDGRHRLGHHLDDRRHRDDGDDGGPGDLAAGRATTTSGQS